MNRDWGELLIVFAICLSLIGAGIAIVSAMGPPIEDTFEARPYPPDIPQCDKDLWDRIREGCDEEVD